MQRKTGMALAEQPEAAVADLGRGGPAVKRKAAAVAVAVAVAAIQ